MVDNLKPKMECGHLLNYLLVPLMLLGVTLASLPSEEYWFSKLPNTPMPESIRDILQTTGNKLSTAGGHVVPRASVNDEYDPSLFFLEKDMYPGDTMALKLVNQTYPTTFLPRKIVSSIPFSYGRLNDILNRLSVKPGSPEAAVIEKTLRHCELPPNFEGEARQCVTSLEAMVDFAMAHLGKKIRAITTTMDRDDKPSRRKNYTIGGHIERLEGSKFAVCHKRNYFHAVYECHALDTTTGHVIRVPVMAGPHGTEARPLGACHNYAYKFDSVFQEICKMLNAKPGVDTVCHFLARDTIVWQLMDEN